MTRERRIALLALVLSLVFAILVFNPAEALAIPQSKTVPQKKTPPTSNQMTSIPYYTLRDGLSSTLTLNNLTTSPMPVNVTVYNTKGKAQLLDPITLDPHSFKQIELSDVVASNEFDSGNIEIAFNGINMAVTSQVSVYSKEKRVSFESREADMMDFESSRLAGILPLPKGADGFLAVTNTAATQVNVQLAIGSKKKQVSLLPRQTELVKLNDDSDANNPTAILVTLQHSGLPGDVIAAGYTLDMKDGYSSAFTMSDPGNLRSSTLAGVNFRAGKPDPSEAFPEGTTFRSPLLLANVGAKPVNAKISVDYTIQEKAKATPVDPKNAPPTEDKFSTASVKQLTIAPGDVQRIELSDELNALGVTGHLEEAGVDIAYDGAPGSLIGQLTSSNETGDYSFEVPIKDPADPSAMVEAVYPWTIENGTDTVLHLKNTTEKSVDALAVIEFPGGGSYNLPHVALEPHQSIAIDIQKLKNSKKPDLLKQAFPADAMHGQLAWHQETPSSMIGRAEQTNVKDGIARSFSCNSGCCDYYYWGSVVLSPSSLTGSVDGSGSFEGLEDYWSCGDYHYTAYAANANSWTSDNTTVATVDSSGTVSYDSGGTATIDGSFHYNAYYWDVDTCRYDNLNDGYDDATGSVTVQVPGSLFATAIAYQHYSGTHVNDTACGKTTSTNEWGYTTCVSYQLEDQYGNNIIGGNYTAYERLDVISQYPTDQTWDMGPAALDAGTFADWLAYLADASPGVPSGYYATIKQHIDIKNNDTGTTYYDIRINCNHYTSSTYITGTDITGGGSCS
jgi:hypothetical protein